MISIPYARTLRDAALAYTGRPGWWGFPCKPRSKTPATSHGQAEVSPGGGRLLVPVAGIDDFLTGSRHEAKSDKS